MNGFEIENNGGSGTAGAHWKQRTAADEVMGGYTIFDSRITNLTLGFFQDLGYDSFLAP